jgi:hypothetical protein
MTRRPQSGGRRKPGGSIVDGAFGWITVDLHGQRLDSRIGPLDRFTRRRLDFAR